ncbi:MAG: MOSC domain-containing protein [Ornithinimicrobium sp.]|uniref:MOSC domain-containing protein n=1 Tax=Ornithinimicrobium sp. TaxID=1977084 RepID=UPI0026E088C5|nr:MOSC N-terminal beta barrel domain-containing protein [Ornithinimicrobium sp.]MDO5740789.1 MOSC domain-containing protein [Ornithinimicrobium sp.]
MRISALAIHPLKSGAIRPVTSAPVGPAGLAGDRTWMVVDAAGQMVSARRVHRLFSIVADTVVTDPTVRTALRLRADDGEVLDLEEPHPGTEPVPVRLFTRPWQTALPAGPVADAWIARAVGIDGLRLVWCDDPRRRSLGAEFGRPGDHTAFADGFPVTIVSEASLSQVNAWIAADAGEREAGGAGAGAVAGAAAGAVVDRAEPLPMSRFRPSVVIHGAEPFAEDSWSRIVIAGVSCRVVKGVDRCVMTTIDPQTLATGREPVRTLARHRAWGGKTWFARHAIPDGSGTWSVGDEVEVVD